MISTSPINALILIFGLPDYAWIGVLVIAAYVWFTWKFGGTEKEPPPSNDLPPLSNTYGSAHYANQVTVLPEGGELVWSGVFFGKSSGPNTSSEAGAPICSKPENHTLIVAKTRTGKGTRVIMPTLLRAWKTSALVIDPKGENAIITARPRSLTNHVHVMNPWGELRGHLPQPWFPAGDLQSAGHPRPQRPERRLDRAIHGATMSPTEGVKEPFWAVSSANSSRPFFCG